ncbi:hypothetical protein BSKO_09814 [Bryopsis sp. KO-2023]|nr:hypothetical protein BSKO_09814 [Bryopsis sp. KO-2023]
MKFFTMGCASSKEVSSAVSDSSEEEEGNNESLVHQEPEITTKVEQEPPPLPPSSTRQPSLASKAPPSIRQELKVTSASIDRMTRIIEKEGSDFFEQDDMEELDNLLNQMNDQGEFMHIGEEIIPLREETSTVSLSPSTSKKASSIPSSSLVKTGPSTDKLPSSSSRPVNERGGKENQPALHCLPPGQMEVVETPRESPRRVESTNGTNQPESIDWERTDSGLGASSPENDPWHSIQKVYKIEHDTNTPRSPQRNPQANDMVIFDEEGRQMEPKNQRSGNKKAPSKMSGGAKGGVRKGLWGEGQMAQAGSLMMGQGALESQRSSSSSGTPIELDAPRLSNDSQEIQSRSPPAHSAPQRAGETDDLALEEIEDLEAELEQSLGKLDDLEAKFLQFERDNPLDDDLDDLYKLEPPSRRS